MTPTITAFERSPDRGKGQARDMRVRWALEEVGQPYRVRLVSISEMKQPAHYALHPFGQIPTYEEGDLALFESGAIVPAVQPSFVCFIPAVGSFFQSLPTGDSCIATIGSLFDCVVGACEQSREDGEGANFRLSD
jgi:hypothetical protein